MESTYADRLYWARVSKDMGATLLARAAGCAQSLISFAERTNSKDAGKFGKKFAEILHVPSAWLVDGDEKKAPPGWNPQIARRARETRDKRSIILASAGKNVVMPRSTAVVAATPTAALQPPDDPDLLMQKI